MAMHCLFLLSSVGQLPYVSNNEWAGYDDDIYHLQAGGAPPGVLSADDYEYYGVTAADLAPVSVAYDDDGNGAGSYDAAEGEKAFLEEGSAVGHALLTPRIAAAALAAVVGFTAIIVSLLQRRHAHAPTQATPAATIAHVL